MRYSRFVVFALLVVMITGCAATGSSTSRRETASETGRSLVGAWEVNASRPQGVGKNLLTFTSDGTFFRSGDTHPVLSAAHGAWVETGERTFEASYVALRFDENRAHIGSQKTRIRITLETDPDQFRGLTKTSTVSLDGTVESTR